MSNQKRNRINRIRATQDNKCCYCTREMEVEWFDIKTFTRSLGKKKAIKLHKKWQNNPLRPTLEHVIPLNLGGKNSIANYMVSCHFCNNRKSNMSHEDFQKIVYDPTSVTLLIIEQEINRKARSTTRKIARLAHCFNRKVDRMLNI